MLKTIMVGAIALGAVAATPVWADEVVIHREAPAVEVVTPPPPDEVIVEKRVPDCSTTRTHTEDEATGDSTTVTRRRCD